jgi:hypothetical protein
VKKETRILLIVAALAVAAYIAIRWYEGKQAAAGGTAGSNPNVPVGSNLNSMAPELIGGSTGPSIGPALSTPITITVNNPTPPLQGAANPVGNMIASANTTRSPLGWANPDNSRTGAQASAPVPDDVSGGAGSASSAGTGTTATTPVSAGMSQPTTTGRTVAGPSAQRTVTGHRQRRSRPLIRPGATS